MKHHVVLFRPYPFQAGQKITIENGPRRGDWEVLEVTDRKIRLRCPISNREFLWDLFCYAVEERNEAEWPKKD